MKRLLYGLGSLFVLACSLAGIASAQPASQSDRPLLTPTPSPTPPAGTVIQTTTPFPTCGPGSDYVVSPLSSATIVAGTTDTGNHCNDCTTQITLPFPYALYGQTYSSVYVSDNGTLQFTSSSPDGQNICLPNTTMSNTIFALWDDLRTDWLTPDPTGIYTSVSNEGGTLVFNIEWRAVYNLNSCCVPVHFEVRLFQGLDRFDVIYQHTDQGGIGTTIGVQRGTGASYTEYLCNVFGRLADGTRLIFRPYACGEATFTPSATSTPTPPTPPPPTSPVRTNTPTNTYTPTITPTASPCIANYTYAEFTATIVPGTVDTGNHCDDCTTVITLPFPVRLYDQTFNTAYVDSNGNLHFQQPFNPWPVTCLPQPAFSYAMMPFWDDLVTDCTGCGVFTSVSGSMPNRIFNVEWRAAPFGGGTGRDNFEIRIYENSTSQRFDFVYGLTVGSANSTIGVQDDNTHWTQYSCNDRAVAPGLCVVFILPPCGSATITATSTHTPASTYTPTRTYTPTASPTCASMWSAITPPPPPGTLSYTLQKVAAIAPDDIWAVGGWLMSSQTYRMLAMHWDGIQWSIVSTPTSGSDSPYILGLTAISHNDVWAVGWDTSASKVLTMHWDGIQWSHITTPDISAPYARLYAVSGVASNDVWAVGYTEESLSFWQTLTMHWDGTAWSIVTSPNSPPESIGLYGVAAVSRNDVWAVGGAVHNFIFRAIILHWDGTVWNFYDLGTAQHLDTLYEVSAASSNDIWAVGVQDVPSTRTLAMHWNGTAWARIASPNPVTQGSEFEDVSVLPSGEALAAGYYIEAGDVIRRTLVEKWDGSAWTIQQTPNSGTSNNVLNGIAAVSQGSSWAVGYHSVPGGTDAPLMLRYDNSCGQITVTPTRTPCPITFTDVHFTDYFYDAVCYLYCMGAITGYADNTFRPFNDTTRGQLTKIVVLAEQWPINTQGGPHFSDVPTTNPFYAFVETAYNRGIITGYSDGTFRWGTNMTRAQLCKIVVLAEGWWLFSEGPHFRDVGNLHPFYIYIETAYIHGIISGYSDGTFRPYNNATRGQISKVVYSAVTQP